MYNPLSGRRAMYIVSYTMKSDERTAFTYVFARNEKEARKIAENRIPKGSVIKKVVEGDG